MISVTRRLEFDAGHRISRSPQPMPQPARPPLCAGNHPDRRRGAGARRVRQRRADGFLEIKQIAKQHIVDVWDHAFLVYEGDAAVRAFLDTLPGHKTVVLDRIPTAENLAAIVFETLAPHYHGHYGAELRLTRVRLYETPNCWADCNG